MTVRLARNSSDVVFDISDGKNLQIAKISDGYSKTFVYGTPGCSATILNELERLAQYQPGVFRLLWMTLVPWSEISEIFVHYAKMYGITL